MTENTPWFLMGHATCIVDLPNIELIATVSYRKRIELWVLRNKLNTNNAIEDKPANAKEKKSKSKSKVKEKKTVDIKS